MRGECIGEICLLDLVGCWLQPNWKDPFWVLQVPEVQFMFPIDIDYSCQLEHFCSLDQQEIQSSRQYKR